ncbi:surface adhesion protein [Pseudomonas corrugata]|uniref:retention module-containing protein n=3 Tax=Pseudomonas TaxID=286 RepID=UPI0008795DD1|nr:retention module-containing protein [Pseudomonas corrugata]SDV07972.1 surface adhesion protein [Pseudomonas corrugata]
MSSVIAVVKSIVGQVFAVSPEGIRRVLIEGDRLFTGDQLDTGPAGAVTLELADGRTLDLGRDTQWSANAPDSSTDLAQATAQAAPSVEELQQAIAAGVDPTTALEATAAGAGEATTGGAAGGGHSVVVLDATAGSVDPTIGFPTEGLGAATANDNNITGLATNTNANTTANTLLNSTLTLSATPTLTEAGGVLVYTATVTQAPLTDLTVTLSNGSVIVISAGQTTGSVNVPLAPNDTVYNDPSQISVTVTGTTGGSGIAVTLPTTPAVTQITDTIDTTNVTLSAGETVTEGGQITYTATLTNPAQTPVTVTLSNGSVITIAAGQTTGTVAVDTPTNDVYNNGSTVSTTITGATGGNFENLVPSNAPAVTTITDSVDTTGLTLSATNNITEGGQITYTATLTNPAQTPVTVTLSNGSVITIAAGQTTGTVNVETPANDVYNNGGTVSTTITGATGGNFENLVPSTTPAVTTITDSVDSTGLTLSASESITEGGSIVYTATLTNAAQTPVTVTLSNGSVITIAAGETTGSVNVETLANDVYNNGSTVSTTITGATGGNFENLVPSTTPAVTTITDSVDTTGLTLSASEGITEGGSIVYTATLTNAAQTPVTVTLSNGSVITIAAGETTGSVNVETLANDVYNNGSTVSTTITGATGGNFENLVPDTTPAVTTITDSVDDTGLTLSASETITEGGSIVYTATLSNPAQTPVTVTLSNGSVITIAAGETTGTVAVNTPANDVYNNGSTVSTTITGATGGNFENLVPDTTPAVTTITDSVDNTGLTLSASETITEGGQITYTATLTNAAQTPVTVTLSNGSVINIAAGETTGTVAVNTPANDVYNNGSTVSTTITGATGGNFENLVPDTTPAVTTITDSVDSTGLTLSASETITEGGQITYTATLTNAAQTPVTVTLSNGSVITIAAGETTGTVAVNTPANDVYNNGSTVSTTITGATGGNFENLVPDTTPAVTTITDSVDSTGLTLSASETITEGGQITYTATLTNAAQTPVTVTLSNGSVITIAAGQTTGTVAVDTPTNDVYNNGSTVSTTITGATGGNFENLVPSTTPAVTTITDSVDTTGLTLSASETITEGGQITYTATLTNAAQTPVTVTLSNGSVITIAAGETTGTVAVNTPANDVYNNGSTVSTTITGATGGNFENLVPDTTPAVTTITDSVDTTGLTLSASETITEGGQITYTATLTNAAQTPVTVTLNNGSVITIAAGETTGTVAVNTPANDVYNNGSTVSTTITGATGGNFENLVPDTTPAVTTITDSVDDTGLTLSASETITEGGQITYTATLTNAAQTPVTVTLSNGSVITIAAGETTGTVAVNTPANDVYNNGSTVSTTITGATGGNFENLVPDTTPAVTTITDSVDDTGLTLSASETITEGGSIVYTATLTNAAQTPVTVTLSNGSVINIAAGETTGTVAVNTPANDVYNNGSTVSTTITGATGGNFENLVPDTTPAVTTITDSVDTTGLTLSASETITEGGQITYTATLTNAAQTPVTVTLSNGSTITIAAGETTGTVAVNTPANDVYNNGSTVSTTITGATGGNFENLVPDTTPAVTTITDSVDSTGLTLSASETITEGGQITYTATLTNAAQTPVTVTLSNGSVINIAAGETTGTVAVNTPANDVYNNGSTVSTTITGATGGNFENLVPDTTPAVTTITDSVDNTGLTLSASETITEGGSIVYTATLTNAAQTPVTVTLSNGSVINIAAGETTGTVAVNTPANDVYNNGSTVSTTITGATGGNFENLVPDTTPAVTTITDSVDDTGLTLSASETITEGGQITYTATLTNAAQTPVTVTLSNGSVITIAAGETTGTVAVNTPANDVYNNGSTVSTTITGATGGNFENLVPDTTPAVTTITDSVDSTGLTLSASETITEGGQITYTATLTNAAQTPVTVTLSNGSVINIAAGETTGTVAVNTPANDVYNNGSTVSTTITGATGGNFENLVPDTTPAVTTIIDSVDTTGLTLSASETITEGGQITYTATLTNAAQTPVTVTLSNGSVINIAAGETTGTVAVNTPANDVYNNGSTVSTTITGATGGNFENLVPDTTPAVTTITDSVDTTGLTLSASENITEGGSIVYTATLSNPAQTPVTVTLSNGSVITIAAGETTGTIALETSPNDVYNNGSTVSTTITGATGGNFENLVPDTTPAVTTIIDSVDTTGLTLSASETITEGGQITYTATLTNAAQTPVTVTLSNGSVINIAAGETTGTVAVNTPANDVYNNGSTVSTTITGATGGNFENLVPSTTPAVTTITDSVDTTGLTLSASETITEGGQITYTATLTNAAQTPVTVTLSNGSVITIAAGETTGTVAVNTPANDVYNNGSTVSTTITGATGGNFENLVPDTTPAVTTITDSVDSTGLTLSASETITEGGQITYTATLTNAAQTPVTVTLSNGSVINIAAGETTGTVAVNTPANDVYNNGSTVSTTITGATGGNFENLVPDTTPAVTTITDSVDDTGLTLSASETITEGGQITYTATLTNAAQTPVTVTLSNGSVINIAAGETTGTVAVNTPANDVYNNGSTVSTTITGATGGNFENLVPDTTPAVTTITDSIDTSTVSLSATSTIAEGGTVVYTASVNAPVTDAPLVVTLSNGQSITIPVGASSASVNFVTPNDALAGGDNLSVKIDDAKGGNYEKLDINDKPANTTVTDVQEDTGLSLSATGTVAEGGQITYTATLTNAAGTPVTVTLSNGAVINIDAGKTTGTVTVNAPKDDVYQDAGNVQATIQSATGGNFEHLVPSTAPAVTAVTDTVDDTTVSISGSSSVTEGQAATYTVSLTNPAQTEVTLKLVYSGTAADGTDFTGVYTVKIPANATSATFNVATLDDKITEGTENFVVKIDSATGGNFEHLAISATNGSVSTSIIDNDAPPVLDLDANNSSGKTGADYQVTFTEGTTGPGVSIGDTDLNITDPDSTMLTGATVVLTNRQPGDALNLGNSVNGISINANSTNGTVTLTLSGNASLADYMQQIKNFTFTNNSDDPSSVPRIITVTVTDGSNVSNTATTTVNVVGVNDAPVATGGAVTGTEDTSLVLGWSTFGVSDVDSAAASQGVKITGLPGDGKLQYLDGATWKDVTSNQTFTKADIDGGKLRFTPDTNESGANGNPTGVGDQKSDYAQIQFQPTDGQTLGNTGTVKIDITPVADAPSLSVADNNVTSTGLIKEVWTSLSGLGTDGSGAPSGTLKSVIDAAGTPNSTSTVTNVQSDSNVNAGTASKTSGLIYLEAGKTYTFSGTGDDSLLVTVGGKDVAAITWGAGGQLNGSFTPTASGYYTLDIYHHNQSGPGSYDVNLSVNGGTPIDLSGAGVPLYTSVTDLANAGVTVSDLHGTNGEGYYDGYKLNEGAEGTSVHLSKITTALTDTDGSEKLSVKIGGMPEGSVLTDGAGHTATVGSNGEATVSGWNLGSLTLTPPAYYNGHLDLTVTSTSTETLGGSAVTTAHIPVTVYPTVYNAVTGTSGNDNVTGTDGNDIMVADIGGLTVVPGVNYNIAFMVDSSGSMSSSSISAAKNSLTQVFNTLKQSLGSNSGTVNIFLADFDNQVNKNVAVNLNDPNALTLLKGVLDSMVSGGGTNYEDVFKTTANFFNSTQALSNTGAKNLTYFITDGQPTLYQSGEQTNPTLYGTVKLDDVLSAANYSIGKYYTQTIDSTHKYTIYENGDMYLSTKSGKHWDDNYVGTVHAEGNGTFEFSYVDGSGYADSWAAAGSSASFTLLKGLSNVEAIGLNNDVTLNDLKPYDSDSTPQTNIDPNNLANSIIGHTEATLPGADTVNGGEGNDILFGDLVSFNGVTGEGYQALQAFVAQQSGVDVSKVTTSNVHQYITEHYTAFDVSGAHDGNDTLLGGGGNDILFGQGGNDSLNGGKGNDILLGGTGNDTLIGGQGHDTLIGGLGGDTFVWQAGDTGNDVIKDFKAADGDRIDLRDLLQGESGSTIDHFLQISTVDGVSSLQVSTTGQFNGANGASAAPDVTIKLEGNNWSNVNLNTLIAGSDPTIKVDHNNS